MKKAIVLAALVFLVLTSVVISAPMSSEYSSVIPDLQKTIEKTPENAGVVARVYVLTTNAQS